MSRWLLALALLLGLTYVVVTHYTSSCEREGEQQLDALAPVAGSALDGVSHGPLRGRNACEETQVEPHARASYVVDDWTTRNDGAAHFADLGWTQSEAKRTYTDPEGRVAVSFEPLEESKQDPAVQATFRLVGS